jgi:hypothetical protein
MPGGAFDNKIYETGTYRQQDTIQYNRSLIYIDWCVEVYVAIASSLYLLQ